MLQNQFIEYTRKLDLISSNDNILLGVSGGMDSMTLFHLLLKTGFYFSVAHCNFSLRGDESDNDEQMVVETCKSKGIKVFTRRFDTIEYSDIHRVTIQVAARELRYNWFQELCTEHHFTKIAIAHNRDDLVETFLINLIRGTGLKGLTGIKPLNGNIVRPLLFAGRDIIEKYVNEYNIPFRNDSSNQSTKYKRNYIRLNVIPMLEQLNPSVKESISLTANHLLEYWRIVEERHLELKEKIISLRDGKICFSIENLINEPSRNSFLVEELFRYGFSPLHTEQILKSLTRQPGKIFYSEMYELVRDRDYLILSKRTDIHCTSIKIDKECTSFNYPLKISISTFPWKTTMKIQKDKCIASYDLDKLTFPLTLRNIQKGDKFRPFGMKGVKKISDFLTDLKIPVNEKDNTMVLVSGEDIIWVVGYRVSDGYKVDTGTKNVYQIELVSV